MKKIYPIVEVPKSPMGPPRVDDRNFHYRVYFLGIGGIAMANLACLLSSRKNEYVVSGSDLDTFGPSAELLKVHGINYFKDHKPDHIKNFNPDIVVIGNAIHRGNPSLEYVLNNQISYCSMPELIKDTLLLNKKPIVITGTSGKTTTTALTAHILKESGLKPTALVGGTVNNFQSGFLNGTGKYVVLEGDEYNSSFYDSNPKFLHYRPFIGVVNNIQPDHLDIYGNIENIVNAFKKFVKIIPSDGLTILNKSNQYTPILLNDAKSELKTFGKNGNIRAMNINLDPSGLKFTLYNNSKELGEIQSSLLGNHNVENILAAVTIGLELKIPFKKIAKAVADFSGVKRRLEVIYPVRSLARTKSASTQDLGEATSYGMNQKNKLTIIDDFAHNPEKVSASLSALRSHFPRHQIIAIFEPRTGSSRRNFFQNAYPLSFKLADIVYIAETFKKSSLQRKEIFSNKKLAFDLTANGVRAYAINSVNQIISHLKKELKKISGAPTIIIVMTSGEFDGIHKKLINFLK